MNAAAIIVAKSKLETLEDVIQRGKQTFFEVGKALTQIMEEQLYKEKGFGSFAEYCEQVWGFKKTYAYQLVQSAEVVKELPTAVSAIVENPGQARALAKVPKEQRETVIKTAVAASKSAGRRLTAKDISAAALPSSPATSPDNMEPVAEPITTTVEPVVEPITIRCLGIKKERHLTGWYHNAAKEKRGWFLKELFVSGKVVEVEDKAKFKQSIDWWLEHYVHETEPTP